MGKALKTVGMVAGAIALVATGVGAFAVAGSALAATAGSIATYASLAAGVANIGSQLAHSNKPPPARGSVTRIIIDPDAPSPYAMGEGYFAGVLRHDVAYGATLKKVPNPYRWMVMVYSVGGPVQTITPWVDKGTVPAWYGGFMQPTTSAGFTPDTALVPAYGAAPGWSSASKMSGDAAIGWNLKFDKDGQRFASGLPEMGAHGKWVKVYDPRKDSTFPGGSGTHRLGTESTYEWSENPALHAGTYAFGRYQNGKRVVGAGLPEEAIDWAAVAAWANVCDANEWSLFGVLFEPMPDTRWPNLRDICEAGGGKALFVGGVLTFTWSAPRTALDTFTEDDLAGTDGSVTAMTSRRTRINTIVPKYRSPDHDWELIAAADAVTSATYVTEDGEERKAEWPFNFVKDVDQAAQLAAYKLVDGRELQPIQLTFGQRVREYVPGDCVHLEIPRLGLDTDAVILTRSFNPGDLTTTFTFIGETAAKHDFALGKTGTAPATPGLTQTAEERDTAAAEAGKPYGWQVALIRNASRDPQMPLSAATDAGGDATITIASHAWDYPGVDTPVSRAAGSLTGLSAETLYYVYFDDDDLTDTSPTYVATTVRADGQNSSDHPGRHPLGSIVTPAAEGSVDTGNPGPGYGYDELIDLLTARLTTWRQEVPADWQGNIPSYDGIGATVELLLDGELLTGGVTFAVVSETDIDVNLNTGTGVFTVTELTASLGIAKLSATYGGVTKEVTYILTRQDAAAPPKAIHSSTPDGNILSFDAWGRPDPIDKVFSIEIERENYSGDTITHTLFDADGNSKTTGYLSASTGTSITITAANVLAASGGTGAIRIRSTTSLALGFFTDTWIYLRPLQSQDSQLWPDQELAAEGVLDADGVPASPFALLTNGAGSGYPFDNYIRVDYSVSGEAFHTVAENVPCKQGQKLFPQFRGGPASGGTPIEAGMFVRFYKRDESPTAADSEQVFTTTTDLGTLTGTTWWLQRKSIGQRYFVTPPDAHRMAFGWYKKAGTGNRYTYMAEPYLSFVEPGADSTGDALGEVVPVMIPSASEITLRANWKGGGYKSTIKVKLTRKDGDTDVSADTTFSTERSSNITSVSWSNEVATLTLSNDALAAGAKLRAKSVYNGVAQYHTININIEMGAIPTVTGAEIVVGDQATFALTATTYASEAVVAGPVTIDSLTGGEIWLLVIFVVEADEYGSTGAGFNWKAQYREVGGGSWSDLGSSVVIPLAPGEPDGFTAKGARLLTGAIDGSNATIADNTDYEFRVIAHKSGDANQIDGYPARFMVNSGDILL